MGSIVQQLQDLPQLTSTDPLCWLGLEPWTPQWTPHCSWAQPPCSSLPQASSSSVKAPAKTQQTSAPHSGDESAAVPVHAVHAGHAGHAGQTPQQGRDTATDTSATQAVSGSNGAGCYNSAVTQAGGGDDLLYSIEEQSGDIQKVQLSCALPTHHAHRPDHHLPWANYRMYRLNFRVYRLHHHEA